MDTNEKEQEKSISNLTIITGAQDFQKGKAFVAVSFKKLIGYRLSIFLPMNH